MKSGKTGVIDFYCNNNIVDEKALNFQNFFCQYIERLILLLAKTFEDKGVKIGFGKGINISEADIGVSYLFTDAFVYLVHRTLENLIREGNIRLANGIPSAFMAYYPQTEQEALNGPLYDTVRYSLDLIGFRYTIVSNNNIRMGIYNNTDTILLNRQIGDSSLQDYIGDNNYDKFLGYSGATMHDESFSFDYSFKYIMNMFGVYDEYDSMSMFKKLEIGV